MGPVPWVWCAPRLLRSTTWRTQSLRCHPPKRRSREFDTRGNRWSPCLAESGDRRLRLPKGPRERTRILDIADAALRTSLGQGASFSRCRPTTRIVFPLLSRKAAAAPPVFPEAPKIANQWHSYLSANDLKPVTWLRCPEDAHRDRAAPQLLSRHGWPYFRAVDRQVRIESWRRTGETVRGNGAKFVGFQNPTPGIQSARPKEAKMRRANVGGSLIGIAAYVFVGASTDCVSDLPPWAAAGAPSR